MFPDPCATICSFAAFVSGFAADKPIGDVLMAKAAAPQNAEFRRDWLGAHSFADAPQAMRHTTRRGPAPIHGQRLG